MARRDRRPSPADFHLWTAVTRSVRPLRPKPLLDLSGDEPLPLPPAEPPRPSAPRVAMPSYQPDLRRPPTQPGQVIEPRMRRKLMRGRIEIDGTIDLHGMRQVEAHAALQRFIDARFRRGDRTILVITGKGLKKVDGDATRIVEKGVLRAMLPIWLGAPDLAPMIAGWSPAAQGHGGEGAFYVRLRRAP